MDDLDNEPTVKERVVTPEQLTAMRAAFEKNRAVTTSPLDDIPRNTVAIPTPAPFETQPITIRPPEPAATQSDPPPTLIIPMPPELSPPPAPTTLPEAPIAGRTTEARPAPPRSRSSLIWGVVALLALFGVVAAVALMLKPEPARPVVAVTRPVAPPPPPAQPEIVAPPPVSEPPAVEVVETAPAPAPVVKKRPTPRRRAQTKPVETPKAPPVVQEGELVKLGEAGVVPPQLSEDVEPKLPRRARMSGATGTVELSLLVDHRGNVEEVRVSDSSGNAMLDTAAKTAAAKARFRPATKHGVPVRIWITRNYNFRR